MKYGIFGGTFDPFTKAHYEIVNKVLNDKLVDKVIVIPSIVNYYRKEKNPFFDLKDRKKILEHWFENRDDVILDFNEYGIIDYSIRNMTSNIDKRRYWHMLCDIKKRYGEDNEYLTIVGEDSWNNITTWFNFRELGKSTKFIVTVRENKSINFYINHPEYHYQPYKVIDIDKKFSSVSATEIRNKMKTMFDASKFRNYRNMSLKWYLKRIDDYKCNGKTREEVLDEMVEMIMKPKEENTNSETLIAHTPIFDMVECSEVEKGFKPVKIRSRDWVTIIVEKDGKFLMEKQLRHGLNKEFEEFPCGIVEDGEMPVVAALRELEEETGIKLNTYELSYLGKFAANPAFMSNYMHYFYVKPRKYDNVAKKLDEHEHLTAYWVDKTKAFDNFTESEGSSIMGCAWMLLLKTGIVNEWND